MLSLERAISAANPTWAPSSSLSSRGVTPKKFVAKSDHPIFVAAVENYPILLGAMKPMIIGEKFPTKIVGGKFHL